MARPSLAYAPRRAADSVLYQLVRDHYIPTRWPLVGFALAARWPMTTLGWLSAALIAAGSRFLVPDARRGTLRRPPPPTVPPAATATGEA